MWVSPTIIQCRHCAKTTTTTEDRNSNGYVQKHIQWKDREIVELLDIWWISSTRSESNLLKSSIVDNCSRDHCVHVGCFEYIEFKIGIGHLWLQMRIIKLEQK